MGYDPSWTDGDRVTAGVHYVRLPHLEELTQAVNRRRLVTYQAEQDYSSALVSGQWIKPYVIADAAAPPYDCLRLALSEKILSPPNGSEGGSPVTPSEMTWLWPEAGEDYGKPISAANPPPEGQVSLFGKLNGGSGFTDPLLTGQGKFARAVHFNELRQVCEWLRYGRWELPIYLAGGITSVWPDDPWWGDVIANDGFDEVRILGFAILRTDDDPPEGIVNATALASSYIEVKTDYDCTVEVYAILRAVDFDDDRPTWNKYDPGGNHAWSTPGATGAGDSTLIGQINCVQDEWVRLDGGAVAAALTGMIDGAPQVIMVRRADSGEESILVHARWGIEFELNSPPC